MSHILNIRQNRTLLNFTNNAINADASYLLVQSHLAKWYDTAHYGQQMILLIFPVLLIISLVANGTMMTFLWQNRQKAKTRTNIMLINLTFVDLTMTIFTVPKELYKATANAWTSADFICPLYSFFRQFTVYLSSFIIVCITIDRYYAVLKPLTSYNKNSNAKVMLSCAWLASFICSIPQGLYFRVEKYCKEPTFKQCMWTSSRIKYEELMYFVIRMLLCYLLPLTVIFYCYWSILAEISKRAVDKSLGCDECFEFWNRARSRTKKMAIVIVSMFIICWTPYYIVGIWFYVDKASSDEISHQLRPFMYLFYTTNSCVNPIVYGIFSVRSQHTKIDSDGDLEKSCMKKKMHCKLSHIINDSFSS